LNLERRFLNSGQASDTIIRQKILSENVYYSHFLNLGTSFQVTKKTLVGAGWSMGMNGRNFSTENRNDLFSEAEYPLFYFKSKTRNEQNLNHIILNLNLRHKLDTSGKEISADADYAKFLTSNNQQLKTEFLNYGGDILKPPYRLSGEMTGFTEIRSAKLDFLYPAQKNTRIEAGVKSGLITSDNYPVFYKYEDSKKEQDAGKSNHFIYHENVYAAYLNISKNLNFWTIQA